MISRLYPLKAIRYWSFFDHQKNKLREIKLDRSVGTFSVNKGTVDGAFQD